MQLPGRPLKDLQSDAKDFIKPMSAWGLGGALGSLGTSSEKEIKNEKD